MAAPCSPARAGRRTVAGVALSLATGPSTC
jgi:hypothetical protein